MSDDRSEVSTCGLVDTKQACVPGRRRHWPVALKRQIVAETLAPGASASMIARRFDVNANQLFRWRRDWREGLLGGSEGEQRLLPVRVAEEAAPGV
jgi:transposase